MQRILSLKRDIFKQKDNRGDTSIIELSQTEMMASENRRFKEMIRSLQSRIEHAATNAETLNNIESHLENLIAEPEIDQKNISNQSVTVKNINILDDDEENQIITNKNGLGDSGRSGFNFSNKRPIGFADAYD